MPFFPTAELHFRVEFADAFIIDSRIKEHLINTDTNSGKLLKPFLAGRDVKKWHLQPQSLWMIYIPKNQVDIDEYPTIKEWLLPFKEKLEARATKQAWYELQQPQFAYYDAFTNHKIYYPDISNTPKFTLDKNGYFAETTLFFIPNADLYLLGLLNSATLWFVIQSICPMIRGGYFRAKAQYIETLPVPEATDEQKTTIGDDAKQCQVLAEQRYTIENHFRRRLPDLCPPEREPKLNKKLQSWWQLDFAGLQKEIKTAFKTTIPLAERNEWQDYFEREKERVHDLSRQIAEREAHLNRTVYELFGLNAEEIALIESQQP